MQRGLVVALLLSVGGADLLLIDLLLIPGVLSQTVSAKSGDAGEEFAAWSQPMIQHEELAKIVDAVLGGEPTNPPDEPAKAEAPEAAPAPPAQAQEAAAPTPERAP